MLLTGTHSRTLDDKKRLGLPKKVRDDFGSPTKLFITPGQDQCLLVYSQTGFENWTRKLDEVPATDAEVRVFRRLYFAQTEAVDVDRSGRILIPDRLLQFAGLQKEVTMIGNLDHLEIWDAQRWQQYCDSNAARFDTAAEALFQK